MYFHISQSLRADPRIRILYEATTASFQILSSSLHTAIQTSDILHFKVLKASLNEVQINKWDLQYHFHVSIDKDHVTYGPVSPTVRKHVQFYSVSFLLCGFNCQEATFSLDFTIASSSVKFFVGRYTVEQLLWRYSDTFLCFCILSWTCSADGSWLFLKLKNLRSLKFHDFWMEWN
jgi:hypothetical protein